MIWDYNVEVVDMTTLKNGSELYPYSIKITKSLIDDSGTVLAKVDTDVDDARENAGPEFITEFFTLAKQVFSSQIEALFTYSDTNGYRVIGPASATFIGMEMRNVVAMGIQLTNFGI